MDLGQTWISALSNKFDQQPRTTTLGRMFAGVKSERWGGAVNWIRDCIANGDCEAANEAKGNLPAAMPSGVFARRGDRNVVKYNGVICLDFDGLEDIAEARDLLHAMPWVAGYFTSPSGTGIKAFAWAEETDPAAHFRVFESARLIFADYDLILDPKCKNVERLCYVSSDPDAVLRDAPPIAVDKSIPLTVPEVVAPGLVGYGDLEGAIDALEALGPAISGSGGELKTRKAILAGRDHGLTLEAWWPYLITWNKKAVPPWDERTLYAKAKSNYAGARRPAGAAAMLGGLF